MLLGCWILGRDGPHLGSGRGTLEEKTGRLFLATKNGKKLKEKMKKIIQMF
jgi:hypothetical protein